MSYSANPSRLSNLNTSLIPATPAPPFSASFLPGQNSIVEPTQSIKSEVSANLQRSGSFNISASAQPVSGSYSITDSVAYPLTPFETAASPFPSRMSGTPAVVPSVAGRVALDLLELIRQHGTTLTDTQKTQLLSQIEAEMLNSSEPIASNETEVIEVLGNRGIWMNKSELINWRGEIPLNEYLINNDSNPKIITKRSQQVLEYIQELAIRYLRPPTPPAPGEIVITQEPNKLTPPAPPLVLRQLPARPITPEPLVIREAPPVPPPAIGRKIITISGKRIPPPPRKVVIERFAQLPAKPQAVLVERWLPYADVKRRVIFQAAPPDPIVVKPRNTIVQWEAPRVNVRKEYKFLGVVRANPIDYVRTFNSSLKTSNNLPDFVLNLKAPDGIVLAADYKSSAVHELEGDLHALNLIDLDREGLGEYKRNLNINTYIRPSTELATASASASASVLTSASALSAPASALVASASALTEAPLVSGQTLTLTSALPRPFSRLSTSPALASFAASAPAQSGSFAENASISNPLQSGSYTYQSGSYPIQSDSFVSASASAPAQSAPFNASVSASALAQSLSASAEAN